MELYGKGVGKNLEAVLGEGSVIRIYCMIFFQVKVENAIDNAVSLKVQMPCPENITLQRSRPSGSYIHFFSLLLGD